MVFTENNSYNFNQTFDEPHRRERDIVRLTSFSPENKNSQPTENEASQSPGGDAENSSHPYRVMSRAVIIEPALTMAFMFQVCSYTLINQYTYYAIGERHNLSAVLEAGAAGGNNTTGGGGRGRCGAGMMNSTAYDLQQQVQAETARFNLYMDLVTDIPGFVVILFFGRLMDQLGRRPALIVSLVGVILRVSLYVLQQLLSFPLELLLLAGLVEALTGGFGTFVTAGYAYLADTVPLKDRSRRMALADISFTMSMSVMNLVMGFMIEGLGFFWPFVMVIGGHSVNLVYILLFVPETRRQRAKLGSISPAYVVESFKVIGKKRPQQGRTLLLVFISAWLLVGFAWQAGSIHALYKLNSPFCWTPSMLGTFAAVFAVVGSATQLVAAKYLVKRVGDIPIILVSFFSTVILHINTAVATKSWMLWMGVFFGCLSSIHTPLMRATLSKLVATNEQGSLFSCLMAIEKVTGVVASALYSNVYAATLYVFKGTVFICMAFFIVCAAIIVAIFRTMKMKLDTLQTTSSDVNVNQRQHDDEKDMKF